MHHSDSQADVRCSRTFAHDGEVHIFGDDGGELVVLVAEHAVEDAAEDAGVVEGDVKEVHRRVLKVKGVLAAVPRHAILKALVDDPVRLAVVVINLSTRHDRAQQKHVTYLNQSSHICFTQYFILIIKFIHP